MVILQNEQLEGPASYAGDGWAQHDTRKFLRVAFNVKNLDASIQFYNRFFGLLLLRKLDLSGETVQRALMAAGTSESECFGLELREDTAAAAGPPTALRVGDCFSHYTVVVPDAPGVVTALRGAGRGELVVEELAAVISIHSHGASKQDKVCIVRDPNGYPWQLLELHGAQARERLCTVSLRVKDLESSLLWYQEVMGMKVLQKYEAPGGGHKSALVGYTPELEGPLLELRQGGPQPAVDPGNAFGWFVVGTCDLARTMVHLEVQGQPWDKTELASCEDPTETVDAAVVSDPDSWRFCLVQQPF